MHESFEMRAEATGNASDQEPEIPVMPEDFLLPAQAFVDRCLDAFDLTDMIGTTEKANLVEALEHGVTKLALVGMLFDKKSGNGAQMLTRKSGGINREWDNYVLVELLERYAPDNDRAFILQAYKQILSREPGKAEALEAIRAFKFGDLSRKAFIEGLASRTTQAVLSSHKTADATSVTVAAHAAGFGPNAKQQVVLAQLMPNGHYVVAPNVWFQDLWQPKAMSEDGILHLNEGWVLAGPKRSLAKGAWTISIDIVQDDAAEIIADLVANSGIDTLMHAHLVGSASLKLQFMVESHHHFIELRLLKPSQDRERSWIKIRDLSLGYM